MRVARHFWMKVVVVLALSCASFSADRAVWRIGTFDHSSSEFRSQSRDYNDPKQDPVFRVGQSKEAENWQRFQPGPANGMAGGREHPFRVIFDLAQPPRGVFRLKIAMLYETPRLSHLRIDINGHKGLIYFHPTLDYEAGDWEGTFVPQTSADTKIVELSPDWLKQGENRLILTALDDPGERENSLGSIATGHSGIVYDAVELTNDPAASFDLHRVHATAYPTIFYKKSTQGLAEVVEVITDAARMPQTGEVQLRVGKASLKKSFQTQTGFGEQKFEFEVPEWKGTVASEITLSLGGRTRRFPLTLTAARKWKIAVVPHEHLDIGFTDYPARVAELHSQSVDEAISLIKKNPDFRWTLDGYWVAQQYLAGRSPEKQKQFLEYIRDGKIIVPPQYANQETGTASLEGLIRSLYGSHEFAQENQIPVGAAHIVDVPSYTWSYASVLNGAGQKYFAAASNSWRAPILLLGRWNEKSPFYWEGPDGSRVLMWYARAYLQLHTLFGSPARLAAVRDALPVFLQAYSRPDYTADAVIVFGSQLENTALVREQADLPGEWNSLYQWPRLEFSTFRDALSGIESQLANHIPVFRGDFGPYWDDGFGSDARYGALHRQNQQRIATAEQMGTVASLLDPAVRPDRGLLNQAWNNLLLFDEHTWIYVGGNTQPQHEQTTVQTALKRSRATEADRQITESIQRSWGQLAKLIPAKEESLAVFNSVSWPRSGLVIFDLQDGLEIHDPATNKPVPFEIQYIGQGRLLPGFGAGYRRVRFLADNVPAMGYKLYGLCASNTPPAVTPNLLPTSTVENAFYRITLDPESGAIKSIFDKELGRELANQGSPYRFGAYVYVTGGDDIPNNSLYRFGAGLEPPELSATPASHGRIVSIHKEPFGTVVSMESGAPNTPKIETEITLFDQAKQIGIRYHVEKRQVLTKEAAYFAFPFAASAPRFSYETQSAWLDPSKDELPGGSREWYAVNHWAKVADGEFSAAVIPIDAPLVSFGDIVRGLWPRDFAPRSGTIFSWVMNNYWNTNFLPWQGGGFDFRYVVTSGRDLDPTDLTRLGWNSMTPIEAAQLGANATVASPIAAGSLLTVSAPNVAVTSWKLAENGQGSILRLQETAGKPTTVKISSHAFVIQKAWSCNLLEDDQAAMQVNDGVQLELKPFGIATLRLQTSVSSEMVRH